MRTAACASCRPLLEPPAQHRFPSRARSSSSIKTSCMKLSAKLVLSALISAQSPGSTRGHQSRPSSPTYCTSNLELTSASRPGVRVAGQRQREHVSMHSSHNSSAAQRPLPLHVEYRQQGPLLRPRRQHRLVAELPVRMPRSHSSTQRRAATCRTRYTASHDPVVPIGVRPRGR